MQTLGANAAIFKQKKQFVTSRELRNSGWRNIKNRKEIFSYF